MGIGITDESLQVRKTLQGLVNERDFEQSKHIEIIVFAICWRLSAFMSPSHQKSIFLTIRGFFPFKFFQGHNWLTSYQNSEFHGHWKTVTLSSISPNLSKHWRFLAFWDVLWELSIVSSLSLYRILVQHASNDHAWLTSEYLPRYGNLVWENRRDFRHKLV